MAIMILFHSILMEPLHKAASATESTIFEEGRFENEGMLFVRVVGNGTHFRGYVNREMKVHGHGDAPGAGSAGLRINGEGIILLSNIELTQLQ